jgi:hypothetical protein
MSRMRALSRRRPSPAMVIALIALFAALGGTATALRGKNSVRSDDIAPGQVKTRDLAPRAVKAGKIAPSSVDPFKTRLTTLRSLGGEVSTTSPAALDLGGPTVTVKVPKGGLVAVLAEVRMRVTGGGAQNEAQVRLFEPSALPTSPQILGTGSNNFNTRFTAPGPSAQDGAGGELRGGWLIFSAGAGTRTFSLRYSQVGGGTAIFQNPKLWVSVLG